MSGLSEWHMEIAQAIMDKQVQVDSIQAESTWNNVETLDEVVLNTQCLWCEDDVAPGAMYCSKDCEVRHKRSV